ncbi:hypothetical protein L914_21573, partial [Phytophthora nicotianae]
MDDAISPWDLYDLSGAVNPDTLSTMIDHFRRFRATRKKNIEVADQQGLRRSWCAFIRRWNQILDSVQSYWCLAVARHTPEL